MIPITDARGLFTRELIKTWDELSQLAPKNFLTSFFSKSVTDAKEVSIQVRRGTEKVAVDVVRGSRANSNAISKHSEKLYMPPLYNEDFNATELDKYDLIYGIGVTNATQQTVQSVTNMAIEKLLSLRYKIERAYELQAAQVFDSGIVQLVNNDNIDFGRKATMMVDLGNGYYWNDTAVNPQDSFIDAGNQLRKVGKATDGIFNVILGQKAFSAFVNNPKITMLNYNLNIKLIDLKMPQVDARGGVFHGQYAAGSYLFNIWTYPEFYEDSTGTMVAYIDDYTAIFLPLNSGEFVMSFAGVPALVRDSSNDEFPMLVTQTAADYMINNYVDPQLKKHVFEVLSAGLTIPVSIDRIYTAVVATENPSIT